MKVTDKGSIRRSPTIGGGGSEERGATVMISPIYCLLAPRKIKVIFDFFLLLS